MPFLTDEELGGGFLPRQSTEAPKPEAGGFSLSSAAKIAAPFAVGAGLVLAPEITLPALALAGAGAYAADPEGTATNFRVNNPVVSYMASEATGFGGKDDPDYDPWADIAGTPYEQHWDKFTGARSADHGTAIKADIDRETKDRAYIEGQGAIGIAEGLAAGLLDPTNLLPFGGAVRSAKGGYSALKSAGSVAAYSAGGAAVSEGLLHGTQQLRTPEETAYAIGGATILGGVLGASIAGKMTRAELESLGARVQADLARGPDDAASPAMAEPSPPTSPLGDGAAAELAPQTSKILDAHSQDTDALTSELKSVAERILPDSVRLSVVESLDAAGAKAKDDVLYGIRAYHGTAYDFDRFDMLKIGTGEGAQAFGHGLYFAESAQVASEYKKLLSHKDTSGASLSVGSTRYTPSALADTLWPSVSGKGMPGASWNKLADSSEARRGWDDAFVRAARGEDIGSIPVSPRNSSFDAGFAEAKAAIAEKGAERVEPGSLYEVDIDAKPEALLDWDKPLSQQSAEVKKALADLGFDPVEYREGRWLYSELARRVDGGPDEVSAKLRDAGIPGVRYLDQGSRANADGTRNIVIFDDNLVTITAKNGEPVTAAKRKEVVDEMMGIRKDAEGAATVEGKYDPASNLITISRAALDPVSTLHHEAVHALKNLGLFTPREWKALENAAGNKGWLDVPEIAEYARIYQKEGPDAALRSLRDRKPAFDFDPTTTAGSREAKIGDTTITYGVGKNGHVELILIKTPKAQRGQGSGRAAMTQFLAEADAAGARVGLNADPMDKGITKGKLEAFYKSFGFKRNAGKSRDFETRLEYLREPQQQTKLSVRAPASGEAKQFDISKLPPDLQKQLTEEAIAMAYQRWISGTEPQKGVIGSAFARMRKFLDAVKSALQGKGFNTPEDIFARIDAGEVAARARTAEDGARAKASRPGSVGAAAKGATDDRLKGALGLEKAMARLSPGLWLQNSPSRAARSAISELGETGTYRRDMADWTPAAHEGAEMGQYGAVESRVKVFQGRDLAEGFTAIDDAFMKYRKGESKRRMGDLTVTSLSDAMLGSGDKMDFRQFREAVGEAMASGDAHPVPEVAGLAKQLRPIFDRWKDEAIKAGLLPEGVSVETAPSYMMRLYNRKRIISERDQFKAVIVSWLGEVEKANARVREQLVGHVEELGKNEKQIEKTEPRIAKREQKLKELEKASEEVQRFHKFAFDRALKGRDTIDAIRERVSSAAEQLAEPLERLASLKDASKEAKDALALLRSFRAEAKKGLDLADEMADIAEVEEALRAIRADETEAKADLAAIQAAQSELKAEIDPFRKQLSALKREEGRKTRTETIRSAERGTFATKARNRGNALADRITDIRSKVEDMKAEVEKRTARNKELEALIEEQVELYQGKTASAAKSAMEARRKADAERDPASDAKERRLLKPVREAAEAIASQEPKTAEELPGLADEIIDRILSTPEGRLPYDAASNKVKHAGVDMDARGPLAARVFMIPDKMISQWLERDIDTLLRAYLHTMVPDIELAKRFGTPDMMLEVKKITEDYAKLSAEAKTPSERLKLHRQRDEDIRNLAAIRDRLRGTYKVPEDPEAIMLRTARTSLTLSYMSKLGGQVVSSFTDPARFFAVHGMGAFADGFIPLFRNVANFKANAREAARLAGALEMVTDSRSLRMADISDNWGTNTKFERLVQSGGRQFGMVSLMAPWNAVMKQTAAVMAQNRILRNAVKVARGGSLSRKETEYMAFLGLSEGVTRRIGEEFGRHGVKKSGLYFANAVDWQARSARDALAAALSKDIDRTIITPGASDLPKFMSTTWGKLLMQFKSFAMTSNQKVLIAGLQQADARTVSGALMSIALGGLIYYLKSGDKKDNVVPTSMNDKNWAPFMGEAFDRSGLGGILMEANNITEKITRGTVGLSAITGKPISRYASRNWLQAISGPVYGMADDVGAIAGSAFDDRKWTQKDTNRIRQMLPYQNLLGVRKAFDAVEGGLNSAFGVPERARAN